MIWEDVPPGWLLQLVAAVESYEYIHGHPQEAWPCLAEALSGVPTRLRHQAEGYAVAQMKEEEV